QVRRELEELNGRMADPSRAEGESAATSREDLLSQMREFEEMGRMSGSHGDWLTAATSFDSALDIAWRLHGGHDMLTVDLMGVLAGCLWPLKGLFAVEVLLEHVIAQLKLQRGESHPQTLIAQHNYGLALRDQGELMPAREVLESSLNTRREVLGPEDPLTTTT